MGCGLLGRRLSHSYSPQIHAMLGSYEYRLYEKEPEQLESFLTDPAIRCLNVTIPYKKDVLPYCAQLTDTARKMGAVNTMVRQSDGSWLGHNTDYFGFQSTIARTGLLVAGKKALVLGSGGAAGTAVAVLRELGANVATVSRHGDNNYRNLHLHADAALIVNATPVGMYPVTEEAPLSLEGFPQLEGVVDMIYNPARTKLLQQAQNLGVCAVNGLWMLVAQAVESAQYFTGKPLEAGILEKVYAAMRAGMENIVLIGMPGSGKTTVGKLLARQLGMPFVDADAEIEEKAGCSIPEIFARDGEAGFREQESWVLANLGRRSGTVIATGGGCVTREENYAPLHANGRIFWLQRSLADLPTEGRPLSQAGDLAAMWQVRQPLYARFADHIIDNNAAPESAADAIRSYL